MRASPSTAPAAEKRQPAFTGEDREPCRARGVLVFALAGEKIFGVTGFAGYPELFPALGLSDELEV